MQMNWRLVRGASRPVSWSAAAAMHPDLYSLLLAATQDSVPGLPCRSCGLRLTETESASAIWTRCARCDEAPMPAGRSSVR